MKSLLPRLAKFGQLSLINDIDESVIKTLDDLMVELKVNEVDAAYVEKPFQYKFDKQGAIHFFTRQPAVDLYRDNESADHLLRFTLDINGFAQSTTEVTVSSTVWNSVVEDIDELFAGGGLSDAAHWLFDETIRLSPDAVAAEITLFRQDNEAIDPSEYQVQIAMTSPADPLDGTALGTMAIWSFNTLPLTDTVTVDVLTNGSTPVSSTELTIDYSQPLNRWEIPIVVVSE